MTGPKILTLDIETRPAELIGFDIWNQNFSVPQIIVPVRMLAFGAKWHGDNKVHFYSEYHNDISSQNQAPSACHENMVGHAFDLMSEADILVTYNGDRFDIPHLNREFELANLGIPEPYKSVDLFKVAKAKFKFISNKLENITQELGLEGKIKHEGIELWLKCMRDDPAAWGRMKRYCIRDVRQTGHVYDRFLPWIDNHPHYSLYVDSDEAVCPRCGSPELQKRGFQTALTRKYQRYQCQGCGGWLRDARNVPSSAMTVRDTR